MNSIYIGDRPIDPPEEDECEFCDELSMYCQCDNDPGEPNEEPDL